jgi:hypothetical protein
MLNRRRLGAVTCHGKSVSRRFCYWLLQYPKTFDSPDSHACIGCRSLRMGVTTSSHHSRRCSIVGHRRESERHGFSISPEGR